VIFYFLLPTRIEYHNSLVLQTHAGDAAAPEAGAA